MGVLVAGLALMLPEASVAVAGGPTSVLLVQPGSAQAAALYAMGGSAEEYEQLQRLVGEPGPDKGRRELSPGATVGAGEARQINITWLMHDVQPWRVDRVYAIPKDGTPIWIHSALGWENGTLDPSRGVWHRAEDPDRLRALLKQLDVMGGPSTEGSSVVPWPGEESDTEKSADTGAADASDTTAGAGTGSGNDGESGESTDKRVAAWAGGGTGWWWAIPGMVLGAGLTLLLKSPRGSWRGRPRTRESGPRQQVLDL